jgi:glutamine synthetase
MTPEELRECGVRLVALVLVDNGGIARMKCVPIDRLAHAAERGIGWSAVWGLSLSDDSFAHEPGLYSPSGDVRLRADLGAAAVLGCSPGWAWAPIDHYEQSGEPWPGCQRRFLRRMAERAAARGVEIKLAWELEWSVGADGPDGFEALHAGPGYGAATFGRTADFMLELLGGLEESGLVPEQIHPEYSDGQMELSLAPRDPLGACDESVLARHIVRAVAANQGWDASFSPRVVLGSVGNGAHVHLSVWSEGENQLAGGAGPEGLRPLGEAFLAGMLEALPALTAIGAPIALSYARLEPSHWAGVYACWGNENREAALRLEGAGTPGVGGSANVEWKSADGAANPYLAAGGLIAAGLDGLERDLRLPPPVEVDPHELGEEERRAGRIARIPERLADAAGALAESDVLREAMGPYLHDRIVAVRRTEAAAAEGLDEETLVATYRWRF